MLFAVKYSSGTIVSWEMLLDEAGEEAASMYSLSVGLGGNEPGSIKNQLLVITSSDFDAPAPP